VSKKTLGSAFLWSAAQTVTRLAVGFLSIKVTAVYLGAGGIALTSQLNNVFTLMRSLISNAVDDGVVTLTAKHAESGDSAGRTVLGTAARWLLMVVTPVSLGTALLSPWLAQWLLGDSDWAPLFVLLALTLPLALFGQMLLSLFSGLRRFALLSFTQIGMTVLAAALLVGCSIQWGLQGGLVATLAAYAIAPLIAVPLARRAGLLRWRDFAAPWDRAHAQLIFSFYPMMLARAGLIPLALLLVRSLMIERLGADDTGLWQSAVRLSDMYTMIIATALNMYSLPTLAAARGDVALRREMLGLAVRIGLGMLVIVAVLFVLRDWIVQIVFTRGFEPVGDIWRYQLVADVFTLMAVPLRQALMIRQRARAYIAMEALVALIFVGGTWLLLPVLGVEAATLSTMVAWICCFAALVWLNRGLIFRPAPLASV
jgi:PST family polysaccharide transporter